MCGQVQQMTINIAPEKELSVSEVFGPTIQGEGRSQGRTVVFLRLGLCNLDCTWCDTPYTWDWLGKNGVKYDKHVEIHRIGLSVLTQDLVIRCGTTCNRVVISGGEPMIQQTNLAMLIENLFEHGITCEIETNATIMLNEQMLALHEAGAVDFNCSPKLENSGVELSNRRKPEALQMYAETNSMFKFVVSNEQDITEIEEMLATVLTNVPPYNIYIMPEGTTQEKILPQLQWAFDIASKRGWSLSPRLHVLAYNDKRGI